METMKFINRGVHICPTVKTEYILEIFIIATTPLNKQRNITFSLMDATIAQENVIRVN